jgi:hypothetical protein
VKKYEDASKGKGTFINNTAITIPMASSASKTDTVTPMWRSTTGRTLYLKKRA